MVNHDIKLYRCQGSTKDRSYPYLDPGCAATGHSRRAGHPVPPRAPVYQIIGRYNTHTHCRDSSSDASEQQAVAPTAAYSSL